MSFFMIFEVLDVLCVGCFVFVVDDENCENEGDVVFFVEFVMFEWVVWIVCWFLGFICVLMLIDFVDQLNLFFMVVVSEDVCFIVYIVSVDVVEGVMIGISVYDCVYMFNVFVDFGLMVISIICFGYVLFLCVVDGGVCECSGYIEVVVELMKFVGF